MRALAAPSASSAGKPGGRDTPNQLPRGNYGWAEIRQRTSAWVVGIALKHQKTWTGRDSWDAAPTGKGPPQAAVSIADGLFLNSHVRTKRGAFVAADILTSWVRSDRLCTLGRPQATWMLATLTRRM
jgi:hypothetical protein